MTTSTKSTPIRTVRSRKPATNPLSNTQQKTLPNHNEKAPEDTLTATPPLASSSGGKLRARRATGKKALKKMMELAFDATAATLIEDIAALSPKDRIALMKTLLERFDPKGECMDDIPGMKIREVNVNILGNYRNEEEDIAAGEAKL
jgi:hypothetical protein